MNRRLTRLGLLALSLLTAGGAAAQEAAQPATPPPPAPWSASCSSAGRGTALECAMEQRVVMSNTGALLTGVTIRLPADSQTPVMLIHTPYGLNLPAGLKLAVDDKDYGSLPLQTCDGGGCYAGSTVAADLLDAMRRGTTLKVTFQDNAQRSIAVPVSLNGFSSAFDRIQQ